MSECSAARRRPIPNLPSSLTRSALVGLAALTGTLAAMPQASAQYAYFDSRDFFDDADVLISPRAVAARLQSRGFHELTRPRFDGTAYVIDATGPAGNRVRLFVDARSGAMLGRRPLDNAYYPAARPGPARPGYGWTEDDASGRQARLQGDLVPPASIPDVVPPPPSRSGALDANPQGINPDGKVRPATPATKKSAKLNQPSKAAVARVAPAAPAPKIEAAKTEAVKPEPAHGQSPATAAVEPAKPAPAASTAPSEPVSPTPAANQEPSKADAPKVEAAPATEAKLEAKKSEGWQEPPPADETKRKVRVIGGATMVPGGSNEAQPAN